MKYCKPYTVNLDEDTAREVELIAQKYQRKPAELLRLLLVPTICNEWAKIQKQEHAENNDAPTLARFTK